MIDPKLKELVQTIHKLYFNTEVFDDPVTTMAFHLAMSDLFNYAGITKTLCENNRDLLGPSELSQRLSAGESLSAIADDGLKRMDGRKNEV